MSNPSDFEIEHGVLKKYGGPGGDVVIPEDVTAIAKEAFDGCDTITSVILPEKITTIGDAAFRNCSKLKTIVIPGSVESVGTLAFSECTKLANIAFRGRIPYLSSRAFMGCTSLQDAEGFVIVGDILWSYHGSRRDITIPQNVSSIGDFAFYCCNLLSVKIPKTVKSIGWNAFMDCFSLQSITFPKSNNQIGIGAFYGCRYLSEITIPEGVTTIESGAFSGCRNVKKISLPKSVTCIRDRVFHGGERLKTIQILAAKLEIPNKPYALFDNPPSRDLTVFAPNLSLSVLQTQGMAPAAVKGFFTNYTKYTDAAVVEEYALYIASNRKKLLPEVLKRDLVEVLCILTEKKKITKKNVKQDYYEPALEYKASKCISFLDNLLNRGRVSGSSIIGVKKTKDRITTDSE